MKKYFRLLCEVVFIITVCMYLYENHAVNARQEQDIEILFQSYWNQAQGNTIAVEPEVINPTKKTVQ